jgi:hypothetical protein
MATIHPMPDLDVLTEVLRLIDAVAAERALGPPAPRVLDLSRTPLKPPTKAETELLWYLAGLDDDHQAQLHALFWIGRDPTARARHYAEQYDCALTTDLGQDGAAYLAAKAPLGRCLRRGLEKLGLGLDRARPEGSRDYPLPLEERNRA